MSGKASTVTSTHQYRSFRPFERAIVLMAESCRHRREVTDCDRHIKHWVCFELRSRNPSEAIQKNQRKSGKNENSVDKILKYMCVGFHDML